MKPTPEATAAANLLAPLPQDEIDRVLYGLEVALGIRPMPITRMKTSAGTGIAEKRGFYVEKGRKA